MEIIFTKKYGNDIHKDNGNTFHHLFLMQGFLIDVKILRNLAPRIRIVNTFGLCKYSLVKGFSLKKCFFFHIFKNIPFSPGSVLACLKMTTLQVWQIQQQICKHKPLTHWPNWRVKSSAFWTYIWKKHRRNCECCPVSQLIVR